MLIDEIRKLKTPAREYLENLYNDLADAIWIPNSMLPEHLHGKNEYQVGGVVSNEKIYGKTPKQILSKISPKEIPNEEKSDREERLDRIEIYELSADHEIQYIENEPRLIKNMMTFCTLMIEKGILDKHDFES